MYYIPVRDIRFWNYLSLIKQTTRAYLWDQPLYLQSTFCKPSCGTHYFFHIPAEIATLERPCSSPNKRLFNPSRSCYSYWRYFAPNFGWKISLLCNVQLGNLLSAWLIIHVVVTCLVTQSRFLCSLADCGCDVWCPIVGLCQKPLTRWHLLKKLHLGLFRSTWSDRGNVSMECFQNTSSLLHEARVNNMFLLPTDSAELRTV